MFCSVNPLRVGSMRSRNCPVAAGCARAPPEMRAANRISLRIYRIDGCPVRFLQAVTISGNTQLGSCDRLVKFSSQRCPPPLRSRLQERRPLWRWLGLLAEHADLRGHVFERVTKEWSATLQEIVLGHVVVDQVGPYTRVLDQIGVWIVRVEVLLLAGLQC